MTHLTLEQLRQKAGEKVTIKGWVQTVRDQASIMFLIVRNIEGTFQVVVTKDSAAYEVCKGLSAESVVSITGVAKLEEQSPSGVEVMAETAEVLSLADPSLPIPISDNATNEADHTSQISG